MVAKAPVPGRVKTRLGATVGQELAAGIAAAALADTLLAATEAFGAARCVLALEGDLAAGVDGALLGDLTRGWTVVPQRGDAFGHRLAHAHADSGPGPLLQIGMDTPQVTCSLLHEVATGLHGHDAVLAPATDGGWWALALRDPAAAAHLRGVRMSAATTGRDTRAALEAAGLTVGTGPELRDVDTLEDAEAVAALAPSTRFAATWRTARAGREAVR